jgi:hypothetical protein
MMKAKEDNREKLLKALNEELGIPKTIVDKIKEGKELTGDDWNKIKTLAGAKKLSTELLELDGVSDIKFKFSNGVMYPFRKPEK